MKTFTLLARIINLKKEFSYIHPTKIAKVAFRAIALFEIENKRYEIQIASDIIRDGLGCELWDLDKNQMLIEIFRNDQLKKIQFYSVEIDVPFEVIEKLLAAFEESVNRKFQD